MSYVLYTDDDFLKVLPKKLLTKEFTVKVEQYEGGYVAFNTNLGNDVGGQEGVALLEQFARMILHKNNGIS